MATHSGQFVYGVSTYGTVLHLDASNVQSYPSTGTVWSDLSGNNNTATLINGPTFSTDSIVFEGVNDTVSVINNGNLSFTNNFTIDATVYITAYQVSSYYGLANMIVECGNAGTYNYALQVSNNTTITFVKRTTGGETLQFYNATVPSMLNQRTNIVVTYINTQLRMYANGVLMATHYVASVQPALATTDFFIGGGNRSPPATAFTGKIYNFRIYNRALPVYEILKNAKVMGV